MSALSLVALALLSAAPPRWTTRECPRGEGGRSSRGIPCGAAEEPTYLEFVPASGAGLPVAEDLCSALAAELPSWGSGTNAWCVGGDGASVPGSKLDFEAFGGATSASRTLCPSGLDCASAANLTMPASGGTAATATNDTTTGPMTACFWGSVDTDANGVIMMDGTAISGSGIAWYLERNVGQWLWYIGDGASLAGPVGTFGGLGAPQLVCMTHAGGTAGAKSYVDGTFSATGPAKARGVFTSVPTIHGTNGGAGGAGFVSLLGAFYVDAELTSGQVAAIARRVLADTPKALVSGVATTALTYTRTGTMFCSKADNTGSILPANRPCISQNTILAEAAATNIVVRSQEFDNAAWTPYSVNIAAPTVTANYGLDPNSTKTAERVQIPSATASDASVVFQSAVFTNGVTSTASLYVRGNGTSGTMQVCLQGAAAYVCQSCAYNATTYARCSSTGTAGGALQFIFGNMGQLAAPAVAGAAHDVLVAFAQGEAGSVATSYIPTTSAAATRGLAMPYFIDTSDTLSPVSLSFAATVSLNWASTHSVQYPTILRLAGSGYQLDTSGKGLWIYSPAASGATNRAFVGSDTGALSQTGTIAYPASPFRVVVTADGSQLTFSAGANTATPVAISPATGYSKIRYIDIGNQQGSSGLSAIGGRISRICLDPRPSRCR